MNKIALSLVALTLSAGGFTTAVLAQTTPTPAFATVDADKSGEVSYSELQLVLPKVDQSAFDTADADKSGGLNATEFATIAAGGTGSLTQAAPADQPATDGSNATPPK